MKLEDIDEFLQRIRKKPLVTILTLILILIVIVASVWINSFLSEKAKMTATSTQLSHKISVHQWGFKNMTEKLSKHSVYQIFGEPIEEREKFWRYKGFGLGFNESNCVGNINLYFDQGINWETEEGLTKGATRQNVIDFYGMPKSGAFRGSFYYYDKFCIEFDEEGRIKKLIIWIPKKPEGLSFSEIEDTILQETIDTTETKDQSMRDSKD